MALWMLILPALAAPAGSQTQFAKARSGDTVHFDVSFKDVSQHTVDVAFDLPAAAVDTDRSEPAYLPRQVLNEASAKAVRDWGRTVANVKVTATVQKGGVLIGASGTGDVQGAMKQAAAVRDQAVDAWLAQNAFTKLQTGSLSFDHAELASTTADGVAPVAAALRAGTQTDRDFVARALAFVQAIPYETRPKKGADAGYRRPLAVLSRNRGDCDSKTVLYLAIVRAELPAVPLAVVYVPNHLLGGVGIPKEAGDQTFRVDGTDFIYVEPVGPAQWPIGAKVPKGHRVSKGEARLVP